MLGAVDVGGAGSGELRVGLHVCNAGANRLRTCTAKILKNSVISRWKATTNSPPYRPPPPIQTAPMAPVTRTQSRRQSLDISATLEDPTPILNEIAAESANASRAASPTKKKTNGAVTNGAQANRITFDSDDEDEAVQNAVTTKQATPPPAENTPEDEEPEPDSDDDEAPEAVTVGAGREAAQRAVEEAQRAIEASVPRFPILSLHFSSGAGI